MNGSLSYTLALSFFAALTFTGRTSSYGDVPPPEAGAGPSPHAVVLASSHSAGLTNPQQLLSAQAQRPVGLPAPAPLQGAERGSQSASGPRSAGGEVAGRCGSPLVGFVNVTRRDDTVRLFLRVLNAPPGEHAVRLHQTADCTAFDAASAGAVWSPRPAAREGESQLGNLGNLHVDASGRGQLAFSVGDWALGGGSETDLIGRALIIHERPSERLGGAEPDVRIGCAVIDAQPRPEARFDR